MRPSCATQGGLLTPMDVDQRLLEMADQLQQAAMHEFGLQNDMPMNQVSAKRPRWCEVAPEQCDGLDRVFAGTAPEERVARDKYATFCTLLW